MTNYAREFVHRAREAGVKDERFLERFLAAYGVKLERGLSSQAAEGLEAYQEELDYWLHDKLINEYEAYKPLWQNGVSRGEIKPKSERVGLARGDISGIWERQEALARYLAEVASEDTKIMRFRESAMSGQLLSEDEALAFLSSPLLADQKLSVLVGNGIGLLGQCHLSEEETDDRGPYRKLKVQGWQPWRVRPLAARGPQWVYPGDLLRWQDARGLRGVGTIFFPHAREEDRLIIAHRDSVLAELFRLAEERLVGYPILPEMGVWFILTGEFIPQYPVRLRYMTYKHHEFGRTTLTLEVEGWVPPEEVAKQYRHAQIELLGKTPRSLKGRTLAVFKFVNQNRHRDWTELFEAWNKERPGWRFKDPRHMNTTYTRALAYITSSVGPKR